MRPVQRKVVFSGVQPSGPLTLANYFGSIKQWGELQDSAEKCIFSIVDQHAITVPYDPTTLQERIHITAAILLASGIDPARSILFVQSKNPDHVALMWNLSCVARIGWLERMTQYKDKAGSNRQRASVGLLTYPLLQAADILAYGATVVPVGEDQAQHVELARDIVLKLKHDFDLELPTPHAFIPAVGARIMSLRNGKEKMSKSDASSMAYISLLDDDALITRKIARAKTDPLGIPEQFSDLEKQAEAKNLLGILALCRSIPLQRIHEDFRGLSYKTLKETLAQELCHLISPIRKRTEEILKDPSYVCSVLDEGAERARALSSSALRVVNGAMGIEVK